MRTRNAPDVSPAVNNSAEGPGTTTAVASPVKKPSSTRDALAYLAFVFGVLMMYTSNQIPVHSPEDFAHMRTAGRLAANTLKFIEPHVVPGVHPMTLDDKIKHFVGKHDGAVAATLGYRGFKHSSCISPNEVVCHGVPSSQLILKSGDIVNVDIAVKVNGWHGDISKTFYVGGEENVDDEGIRLVKETKRALQLGLSQCKPYGRIGDIVAPIRQQLLQQNFTVVNRYAAHGLGQKFHQPPTIKHGSYKTKNTGFQLKPGYFFTVEPMANEGVEHTELDPTRNDQWTVVTTDRKRSAQFEHTIGVGKDGCEIFTSLLLAGKRHPSSRAFDDAIYDE